MSLQMRWVGEAEFDRVAETRMLCYAPAPKDLGTYQERLRANERAKAGDFLLAEQDGRAVGTATSLSMVMWVRGRALTCQGVAYVGAIKTERRKSAGKKDGAKTPGIATAVMNELIKKGRERGEIISGLMPFRGSFYEHFGYGMVERRNNWTVPLSILPAGEFDGFRVYRPSDLPALQECRQRVAQQGQCDLERPPEAWSYFMRMAEESFLFIDRPEETGPIHGWLFLEHVLEQGQFIARILDSGYDSPAALKRQLYFLASLKDQYSVVKMPMPADVPLNFLLRESQLPHRPVTHAFAQVQTINRLQVRILDHVRFLEGMSVAGSTKGSAVVAVREVEGNVSKFRIEVAEGKASAAATDASADVECADKTWASIACGDLPASMAAKLGLIDVINPKALGAVSIFSHGPVPFCRDAF